MMTDVIHESFRNAVPTRVATPAILPRSYTMQAITEYPQGLV